MALFHTMPQTSAFPFLYLYPFWITTSWTRGAERKRERQQKTISCFLFVFFGKSHDATRLSLYSSCTKNTCKTHLHYFQDWSFRLSNPSSCLLVCVFPSSQSPLNDGRKWVAYSMRDEIMSRIFFFWLGSFRLSSTPLLCSTSPCRFVSRSK
jgi:hypothetical protein